MSIWDAIRSWFGFAAPTAPQRPAVAPSWLQIPTLAPGGRQEIVGESHYQGALQAICGGRDEDGTLVDRVTAVLERDRFNRHDRNAVRVLVAGRTVGHIPRDRARLFHQVIEALDAEGQPSTARARLTGGWDRGPDDRGTIGLELDLALPPRPTMPTDPFLPMENRVALVGEEKCVSVIETVPALFTVELYRAEENPLRPRTPGPFLIARAEAGIVGCLSPTMTARYLPLVEAVGAAGLPITAQAYRLDSGKTRQIAVALPGTA